MGQEIIPERSEPDINYLMSWLTEGQAYLNGQTGDSRLAGGIELTVDFLSDLIRDIPILAQRVKIECLPVCLDVYLRNPEYDGLLRSTKKYTHRIINHIMEYLETGDPSSLPPLEELI